MTYILVITFCVTVLVANSAAHLETAKHTNTAQLDGLWDAYKVQFNKVYRNGEEKYRRLIWVDSVNYIQRHNLQYDLGQHTYTVGLNEYADLTPAEYRKYLLGFRPQGTTIRKEADVVHKSTADLPDHIDWRQKGYVTPIKNQGQCGSCWAFSSTGSLEGQHYRQTGRLISLSEQNLVDCCHANDGCNGGWMTNSFKYISDNNGLDTEAAYPYEAKDDTCRYDPSTKGAEDTGFVAVNRNEDALKAAVAHVGPVAVAIDAAHKSFQLYKSGVYVEPECSKNTTDHAVLVVGYGVWTPTGEQQRKSLFEGKTGQIEKGQDYWLVKNSWGTSWGMEGYIMMARNKDNQCAIASFASYPTV